MRKDGNPLEVWLADAGEEILVGWLRNIPGAPVSGAKRITLRRDDGHSHHFFDKTWRAFEIEGIEFLRAGFAAVEDKVARNTPGYAVQERLIERDVYRFTWEVLLLEPKDYEWVFELKEFEPIDSEPDTTTVIDTEIASVKIKIDGSTMVDGPSFSGMVADKVWLDEIDKAIEKSIFWKKKEALLKAMGDKIDKTIYEAVWPASEVAKPSTFKVWYSDGATFTPKPETTMTYDPRKSEVIMPRRFGKSRLMSDWADALTYVKKHPVIDPTTT